MTCTGRPLEERPSIEQLLELKGSFLFPRGLDGQALIVFIKYLSGWSGQDKFLRLWGVFGNDLLLFMSIFQGESVKVPPIAVLQKIKTYAKIYAYLWERQFSDRAYSQSEKIFGKKKHHLIRIVRRVERVLKKLGKPHG